MASNIDWKRVRNHRWADTSGPPEWPTGVRPISMEGASLLGIDPNNRLYWDGEPLVIERQITLTRTQMFLAANRRLRRILFGPARPCAPVTGDIKLRAEYYWSFE
jgi:hypothetical protein